MNKDIERSVIEVDVPTTAKAVESIVLRGDISAMTPEDRSRFYFQMCDSLGLSPASLPFAILRLNGKEILYPTRAATDQLAAIHRLNRKIIDGPKVIDLAGTKLVYAVCEATHPNGRTETAVATVPLGDHANVMMKCETKAKRRATLSILGLGMLDESELEGIPEREKQPAEPVTVSVSVVQPERPKPARVRDVADGSPPPQSVLDDVSVHSLPLTIEVAATIHNDQNMTSWPVDDKSAAFEYLLSCLPQGSSSAEFQRSIAADQWDRDVRAAKSIDELVDIFTEARKQVESNKTLWGKTAGPAAIAKLKDKCAERKKQLQPPPEPPTGGGEPKPTAPVVDEDPERAAIEAEAVGTIAQAQAEPANDAKPLPLKLLKDKLAECTATAHLYNTLLKYGPGQVSQEEAVQAAAERMVALGASLLPALKAVRDEIGRRGGWKPKKAA